MVEHSGYREGSSSGTSVHSDVPALSVLRAQKHLETSEVRNSPTNWFSIFKWFKRSSPTNVRSRRNQRITSEYPSVSELSSCESVDTFYSTATVRSFAFHSGNVRSTTGLLTTLDLVQHSQKQVGPFGSGAAKVAKQKSDVTKTLPANVLSHKRDITARYSLQSCTTGFGSCTDVRNHQRRGSDSFKRLEARPVGRGLHVRGKRRAPNPPGLISRPISVCSADAVVRSGKRKRRPAPKPPGQVAEKVNQVMDVNSKQGLGRVYGSKDKVLDEIPKLIKNHQTNIGVTKDQKTNSNDSLVLQGGFLLSKKESADLTRTVVNDSTAAGGRQLRETASLVATAMPRLWYKRSVFENPTKHVNNIRGTSNEHRDELGSRSDSSSVSSGLSRCHKIEKCTNENSVSRRSFFNRDKTSEDKRKDIKRRSGLSILTNISELDKEAAAIVQEEQAKSRALLRQQQTVPLADNTKRNDENQEVIQDMVTSVIENSPRRGTRALISKFNAIGNITKVTVNSTFFTKSTSIKNQKDGKTCQSHCNSQMSSGQSPKVQPDLSAYFPKHQSPKLQRDIQNSRKTIDASRISFLQSSLSSTVPTPSILETNFVTNEQQNLISDVTNRLTTLQSVISHSSKDFKVASPIASRSRQETSINETVNTRKPSSLMNSPNVSRARFPQQHNTDYPRGAEGTTKTIHDEFAKVFERIDKQLSSPNIKLDKVEKTGIVNTKKQAPDITLEVDKGKKNTDDQTTTDLKQILKEMKHSLPKRSKPKRTIDEASSRLKNPVENIKQPSGHERNQVKIIDPPIIRMGPSKIPLNNEQRNADRQKVSSSVQTSGNVRKISSSGSTQWRADDVIYETSGRAKTSNSALVQNTFQLMRPREFAAIEAIKTLKTVDDDNTYVNVIGQSLYANAMVLPVRNHQVNARHLDECGNKHNKAYKVRMNAPEELLNEHKKAFLEILQTSGNSEHPIKIMETNMNTLAVNRLLRKLEGAIASGNHQQAATFAKELAVLKIPCSVMRQRPNAGDLLNVDMFIEDRLAHQGPIPLQLPLTMTVAQLKMKIFNEFEIPANVQRWIIGNTLADNENATLEELKAIDKSTIFLYLVAPDLQIGNAAKQRGQPVLDLELKLVPAALDKPEVVTKEPEAIDEFINIENTEKMPQPVPDNFLFPINDVADNEGHILNPEPIVEKHEEKLPEVNVVEIEEKKNVKLDEKNIIVMELEKEEEEEGAVALDVTKSMVEYNELMLLESCGLVVNQYDHVECPICMVIYGPLDGIILRNCLHEFCRPCIENTIKYCNDAEVKCPYRDATYTCEATLQEREIKALVDPQVYEQHLAKSVAQAENNAGHNAFHCKTPDCPGWCIYDDNVNNFLCPVCDMTNCLTCRVIHNGRNCWEYQDDLKSSQDTDHEAKRTAAMLADMLQRGEAMNCPTCDIVLMKKLGCDWLKCSMCKTEICWVTKGPRWGLKGAGDTSGGCRCRIDGKRCHPNCNYCH